LVADCCDNPNDLGAIANSFSVVSAAIRSELYAGGNALKVG
jgi:hypothetical protein